jgi:hypothetical protein
MTIRPLYSPGQVAGATFVGGPIGGGWLLAMNYRRLGAPGKARMALVLSVLAMAALVAAGLVLPKGMESALAIGDIIAMSTIARMLQGEDFERHVALGGRRGSSWHAVGIGLASLAICVGLGAALGAGYAVLRMPPHILVGKVEVRYADGGTQAEAQAVGDTLVALGAAASDTGQTIEVRRAAGRHVVAFVVQDFVFSSDGLVLHFHDLANKLSSKVFADDPVDIWLTDDALEPLRKLDWKARPHTLDLGGDHLILYRNDIEETEIQAAARVLTREGFFVPDHPSELIAMRFGATRVLAFVSAPGALDDPQIRAGLRALAAMVSKEACGDQPVDLWLLDDRMSATTKLTWDTRTP